MNKFIRSNQLIDVAKKIAEKYQPLPNISAIAIGGSLARGLSDDLSDIEMYVYYDKQIPSKEIIAKILSDLDAKLTRSNDLHWHHPAWGYHSFFSVDEIKFELGYREIDEIKTKIERFKSQLILPEHGIHDTPFGHYQSGLASCISECIILSDKDNRLSEIKSSLEIFPDSLRKETIEYYFDDAKTLTEIKLKAAAERNDTYNFNAIVARIIRSITIVLFALNSKYYPGDKWNGKYIESFSVLPTNYDLLIKEIFLTPDFNKEEKQKKYTVLRELIEGMELLISQGNKR